MGWKKKARRPRQEKLTPRRRKPDPDLAQRGPCALCGREARGFGYVHKLLWNRHPHYRFCSMGCLDCGSEHAARNKGMIDKTDMETKAIRHARRHLAEALSAMELMPHFHDRSAAEIDRLIEACVDGFQEGMQAQVPAPDLQDNEIPF